VQLIDDAPSAAKIAKIFCGAAEQGVRQAIVADRGLGMISDPAATRRSWRKLLAAIQPEVEAFRGGKTSCRFLRGPC